MHICILTLGTPQSTENRDNPKELQELLRYRRNQEIQRSINTYMDIQINANNNEEINKETIPEQIDTLYDKVYKQLAE